MLHSLDHLNPPQIPSPTTHYSIPHNLPEEPAKGTLFLYYPYEPQTRSENAPKSGSFGQDHADHQTELRLE